MRERLDCAVLVTRCTRDWVAPAVGSHAGGRLHVHSFDTVVDIESDGASGVLANEAMALRRFDACMLPVTPATLSWARISLSQAVSRVHTPIIVFAKELTAAALYDLHELGAAEFLRDPFCPHELRVRLERLLDDQRRTAQAGVRGNVTEGGAAAAQYAAIAEGNAAIQVAEETREPGGYELEAYAIAAASRSATTRESFRDAKSHVIARFERAYLTAALGRHGGNIAMAARAAQKHRRAFWALMRKHDIDAAPFREMSASVTRAGRSESRNAESGSSSGPSTRDTLNDRHDGSMQRPLHPGLIHYARTGVVLRNEARAAAPAEALTRPGG